MSQPGLFDAAAGIAAREEAIKRVGRNADPAWLVAAVSAVKACAASYAEFTTDEVWQELADTAEAGIDVPMPHEPRALAVAMRRGVALGLIRATNRYRPTIRAVAHRRPVRVWESR